MLTGEPSLEEILSEPIIQLLMAADRVSLDELRALYAVLSRRISGIADLPPPIPSDPA
jgi:hypothetical protein